MRTHERSTDDDMASLPVKARLAMRILSNPMYVVGAIACFLVWWLTTVIDPRLSRLEQQLMAHEASRLRDMQFENAFLYAICINTASDAAALARCAIAAEGALASERKPK
jgi:hypothetical protein